MGGGKLGRPAFTPTAEQRRLVELIAGFGVTDAELAEVVSWPGPGGAPISERTLRQHFRAELDRGRARAAVRLKQRAYELALAGDNSMLIFLLKTRCGFRETVKVEHGMVPPVVPTFYEPNPAAPTVASQPAEPQPSTPAPVPVPMSTRAPAPAPEPPAHAAFGGFARGDFDQPASDPRNWR